MGEVINLSTFKPGDEHAREPDLSAPEVAFDADVKAFTLALLLHRPELGLAENANLLAGIITAFRDFEAQKVGLLTADAGDRGGLSDDSFDLTDH
jgi:hypothetical protein